MQAKLLINNINEYFEDKDQYPLSESVLIALLKSDISMPNKFKLVEDIDAATIANNSQIAALISQTLYDMKEVIDQYDTKIIILLINLAKLIEVKIYLIIRYEKKLDNDQLLAILENLREPFCKLAENGKRPKFDNSDTNRKLLTIFKERGIITGFKVEGDNLRVNMVKVT